MTRIRVDPAKLRQTSQELDAIAKRLRLMGAEARDVAAGAPSYEGQFGPKARAMGLEAEARLRAQSDRFAALSEELLARAEAFDAVDRQAHNVFRRIGGWIQGWLETVGILSGDGAKGGKPPGLAKPAMVVPVGSFSIIPPWLVELILSLFPFGDAIGILRQLGNMITSQPVDGLDLGLSVLGLVLDFAGSPFGPDDAGVAVLKSIAKAIPPGPARQAFEELLEHSLKNTDEAVDLATSAGKLAVRPALLEKILTNHPEAIVAILKGGPEAVEQVLKYSDDVILRYLDEAADVSLANLDTVQGLRVSGLAQDFGVDIHVAGRWADTPAEKALREQAYEVAEERAIRLAEHRGLPLERSTIDGLIDEVRPQVASEFGIDPYQVKKSGEGPEIDVFIPDDQWRALSGEEQESLRKFLAETFEVDPEEGVDFYQILDPRSGYPDPKTNIPPGSIHFGSDGAIEHQLLGNLEAP